MASSGAKKRKKKVQAQRRQQHATKKNQEREAHHEHLPKTGTAEDDDYVLRRSREDLLDFGLARRKKGWVNVVLVIAVLALLAGGVLGLIILSTR